MKNDVRKDIDDIAKLHIRQDQYACVFTDTTKFEIRVEENKEFRSFDIYYSPKLVEELVPFFPELKELLATTRSILLPGKRSWALPSMKEIITQLLDRPYDEATRQFYFDLKVRELLY